MVTRNNLTIIHEKVKGSKTIHVHVYTKEQIENHNAKNKFNRLFENLLSAFNIKGV